METIEHDNFAQETLDIRRRLDCLLTIRTHWMYIHQACTACSGLGRAQSARSLVPSFFPLTLIGIREGHAGSIVCF